MRRQEAKGTDGRAETKGPAGVGWGEGGQSASTGEKSDSDPIEMRKFDVGQGG